ncbi:MAG: glycerophosphodiester phosphodiesterase family protein [Cyclobacteriaceae bacterium]|nr:glycerophosphodiester phosphodiesterase family protein [Cyclobacteriaceae bacterium]
MSIRIFVICLILLFTFEKVFAQPGLQFPEHGSVYVIAHRGVHSGIPENSISAYQEAIRIGCDFIEIDVRTTRDGQLISIHNSTIDEYASGQTGKVRDLTLAELRKLDIGEKSGAKWSGTHIPTLEEVLQVSKGKIKIYLDLKDADPSDIISLLVKYGMQQQVVWYIPGNLHKAIMEVKQECPPCLVMPDPGDLANIERVAVAYNPPVIATDMKHLSLEFVQKAHERRILVFTDDDEGNPEEWEKMIAMGTDGIQTDAPEELIKYLQSRKGK